MVLSTQHLVAELKKAIFERNALAKDAERYNWLKHRVTITRQEALSGKVRPGLALRFGCSFVDSPATESEYMSNLLDVGIDAALAATQGEKT